MRSLLVACVVVAACNNKRPAESRPGGSPASSTSSAASKTPDQIGAAFGAELGARRLDAAVAMFTPDLASKLPATTFGPEWDQVTGGAGAFVGVVGTASTPAGGATNVLVRYRYEHGTTDQILAVTDGAIRGVHSGDGLERYEAPAYVDPKAFDEEVAWLGSGATALPATIVVPHAASFPLVIFVHGSGGGDEDDSTPGGARLFRDLAGGLATRGIGSLRWVKRTHPPYGAISKLDPKTFTIKEEYLDDVATAIALAKTVRGVDPKRIFIAGHSEGGWLTPWLLKDHPELAGGITLAGNARHLSGIAPSQLRYIAEVHGLADNPIAKAQIAKEEERSKRAHDPDLSDDTPADDLPLGVAGAASWRSVAKYDAPATAKALAQPLLVLQGGRDYQVTADDDLPLWKTALDGKAGSTTRLYPKVNHDFVPGDQPITPEEYSTSDGHVEDDVVADIAAWISPPK
jgi:dienelactone hydrolase